MGSKTRFCLNNSYANAMLRPSNSDNDGAESRTKDGLHTACDVLDAIPDPVCVATTTGNYRYFNEAWIRCVHGGASPFNPTDWLQSVHADDVSLINLELDRLFRRGGDVNIDFRLLDATGCERWFMLRARPWLVFGEADPGWLLILTDIHERKCAESALSRQLASQKQMLDITHDCIKVLDPKGNVEHMNRAGCEALNVNEHSRFGMEWLSLLPREVYEAGSKALQRARIGESARFPGMSLLPGAPVRHWDNMLTPLVDQNGHVDSIVCVSRDITTQKEDHDRIQFLMGELDHRTRNMLAIVQALVMRTVPDPRAQFVNVICQRIQSIARCQDLLVNGEWTGISVLEVVRLQTAISGDYESRFRLMGDREMKLDGRVAETIGMAIYELTTNAIKHGALSGKGGNVTVEWGVSELDSTFQLTWKEFGGPAVDVPQRKGFGASVIGRNPFAHRGARVSHAFERDGVRWEFVIPSQEALASSRPPQPTAGPFQAV